MEEEQQALALSWVYGASSAQVKHSIVNLSDAYTDKICYISAHTGVIYDKRLRRQTFLQGHTQPISCMAATEDRSVIITGDQGAESMLVVWNSATALPLQTLQQPHPHGVLAMDISPDGEWLATVSAPDPASGEQEVALWPLRGIIGGSVQQPTSLSSVPSGDTQTSIRFNVNNVEELISNGKRRVYFWSWAQGATRFKYYSPPLRSKDFKQSVGDFVSSVFVPGTNQALTATSDGDLVVWDEQGIAVQMGTSATDRRAIKLMRVHNSALTLLITIGDYIVTGGEDGYVRFFDPLLRIVAWFEDLGAGPILSVAFSSVLSPATEGAGEDGTEVLNRFLVPDFVVATREGRIVSVRSRAFEEFDAAKRTGTPVLDSLLGDIVAMASHPTRAEICVLGRASGLQTWDSIAHIQLGRRTFSKPALQGTCLAYSRDGAFIVLGAEGGQLSVINGDDLSTLYAARNTPAALTQVSVSSTSLHLAAADASHQVLLYAHLQHKTGMRWEFIGKIKSHHGPIVSLVFGESPSGRTRLFSLGSDGRLVEYDLAGSSITAGLRTVMHHDFAAGSLAAPTAMAFAPPLQYFRAFSADTQLLICDDAYKVRVFNPDDRKTVATLLGPTFAGPPQQLLTCKASTAHNDNSAFLAYHTGERVVGLISWPLDGDPSQTMGLLAHPGTLKAVAVSYDGRRLFSAGDDGCLAAWDVSASALEARAAGSVSEGAGRWSRVLGDEELLEDLKDYFVYAQLAAQGEDVSEPRAVTGKVPLSSLPDLMRAAGYYPSQADIQDINNHVEFLAASRDIDAEGLQHIDFGDFLALYINHRPLFPVTQDDVVAAFKDLGAKGNPGKLSRDALINLLGTLGEGLNREELSAALHALTGMSAPEKAMHSSVTALAFSGDVLGFEEVEAAAQQQ